MNERLIRRVRALRKDLYRPIPITTAVAIARHEQAGPPEHLSFLSELEPYPCQVSGMVEGFEVLVEVISDDDRTLGEDDVTGTFTDDKSENTIRNSNQGARVGNGTDYRYYEPANYRRDHGISEFRAAGMSKSVALDAYRAAVEKDMADDVSREWFGLDVTVKVGHEIVGEASLWGIDTIDGYDVVPYFIETVQDLLDEAMGQARDDAAKTLDVARSHAAKLAALFGMHESTIVVRSQASTVHSLVHEWVPDLFEEAERAASGAHVAVSAYVDGDFVVHVGGQDFTTTTTTTTTTEES